jgi:phosphohistidine phosphatase SixA
MKAEMVAVLVLVSSLLVPTATRAQDDLLGALRTAGHFGLMRHSTAPGTDAPPNFRLGDCATQRNLSAGGRMQAQAIGARLRAARLTDVRLVSSQWCRCLDTARLLAIGPVEELSALNSLVSYPGESATRTQDARSWILGQDVMRPTILVTHQINISALVGAYPNEGDIVVVQRTAGGDLRVVGTITAD